MNNPVTLTVNRSQTFTFTTNKVLHNTYNTTVHALK